VLIATSPVRNLIREGRSNQLSNVMFTNTKEMMMTLESSLATMISDGIITYEDAMSVTAHPKELIRTLEQLEITRAKG
jgi:twitching motility protein PilT